MPDTFARYQSLVAAGEIEHDDAQAAVARRLGVLNERLKDHRLARKSSSLGWLFGRREASAEPIRGLYVHGAVGRGKTMLMDLFLEGSPIRRKRRAHFHEFMADAHRRIHAYRQQLKRGEVKGDDPIAPVAAALADEAWLLCFDEFSVTDIADAMILGRLFGALFEHGVVVVATSNVAPDDLYCDGLNRALFLPFIALMKERLEVTRLDARTDFRLEKLAGAPVWSTPVGPAAEVEMDAAWRRLVGPSGGAPGEIAVNGRLVPVPAQGHGVARFDFADLCAKPLGASDYLALAHAYHTIFLDRIPAMVGEARRNEAKRFITLIDALYDNRVKLVASAEAPPAGLYRAETGVEAFEFQRTVSRLIEMGSHDYMALAHGRGDRPTGSVAGLVET